MTEKKDNQPMLPSEWGNWQLVRKIGDGAYGTVYEAEQTDGSIKARSAVKIITIPADSTEEEKLLSSLHTPEAVSAYLKNTTDRLGAEVQAMYDLQGEAGIVSIQDHCIRMADPLHWQIFIRMELLTDFATYQMMHRMDERECIRLGIEICEALEKCEARHILHRDVKPENIFVTATGAFKLGDFGVAQHFDLPGEEGKSQGTPVYMAPEAVRGETYDNRSDLYSLGLVLYRLMNNNAEPFLEHGSGIVSPKLRKEALKRRLGGEALPAPVNAGPAFAQVVLKSCAFRPEDRYQSAAEMRKALESLLHEKSKKTAVPKWLLPVGLAAALLLAVAGIWSVSNPAAGKPQAPAAEQASQETERTSQETEAAPQDIKQENRETEAVSQDTEPSIQETEPDAAQDIAPTITPAEAASILMRESEEISWVEFENYDPGHRCIKNSHLLIGTYIDQAGGVHPAMLMIVVSDEYVDLYVNIHGSSSVSNTTAETRTGTVSVTEPDGSTDYLIFYWNPGVNYYTLWEDYRDTFIAHMGKQAGNLLIEFHDAGWGIKTASFEIPRNQSFREAFESIVGQ